MLREISRLSEKILDFMKKSGLQLGVDFSLELLKWVDYEIENWEHIEIRLVPLSDSMDKFDLLKNLVSIADQALSPELRREIVITVG